MPAVSCRRSPPTSPRNCPRGLSWIRLTVPAAVLAVPAPRNCKVTTLFVKLVDPDRTRRYALPSGSGA